MHPLLFQCEPPWHEETTFKEPKHDGDGVGGDLSCMETSKQNMWFLNFRDLFATASSFYESCFASTYLHGFKFLPTFLRYIFVILFSVERFPKVITKASFGNSPNTRAIY